MFLKLYFWFFLTLNILCYIGSDFKEYWGVIDFLVSIWSVVGLYLFAYKRGLFNAKFWKLYLPFIFCWDIFYNIYIVLEKTTEISYEPTVIILSIILVLLFLPIYPLLYFYAFRFLKKYPSEKLKEDNDKVTKALRWLLWDFSGIRFIYYKMIPRNKYEQSSEIRPPSSFLLWFIGIYLAFFGVASQRYENTLDLIENRTNIIITQLGTPYYKQAISRIPYIQGMKCPYKPSISKPYSIIKSLFFESTEPNETVELLQETIENWKDSLELANLRDVDLKQARLSKANFRGAFLAGANFTSAYLEGANFQEASLNEPPFKCGVFINSATFKDAFLDDANFKNAYLVSVNFSGSHLVNANFDGANLRGSDLEKADLNSADVINADLAFANLINAENLTVEQLCKVKSLYETKIEMNLERKIRGKCPDIFKEPTWQTKSDCIVPFKIDKPISEILDEISPKKRTRKEMYLEFFMRLFNKENEYPPDGRESLISSSFPDTSYSSCASYFPSF